MFDPTDDNLEIFREGDAAVMPGAPTGGEYGEVPVADYGALPGREPVMWAVYRGTLAIGASITINVGDRPHYWLVYTTATASVVLSIWPYETPAGAPTNIGASPGRARIPGLSQSLTLQAAGAIATYTAIAVRNFDLAEVVYGT